ncbi:MAG: hypothetical protein LUD57_02960 [Ruminococcus sp.]|nr:hypothetical protein [Ruminococcus sp.]
MIFSSLLFIYAFFPVSVLLYYITPAKYRNYALFVLNIAYCGMCGLSFLIFMILYTLWNYAFGLICGSLRKHKFLSGAFAFIGIAADALALLVLREDMLDVYVGRFGFIGSIAPIGISFTVLSAVGYLLDVCRERISAERNILNFSAYMMFFPKLPMGPLVGYARFRSMLKNRSMGLSEVGAGASLFIKGLAKKVIFADNLYMLYSAVSSMDVKELSSLSAWLGVFSYSFCLYFTLSGFSDMGAGIARCFGFRLPKSFKYPLLSAGLNDFCRRWHIPVMNWFNRYIVRAVSKKLPYRAVKYFLIISVWGLIGLWYDFSVNKLVWGLLIGVAVFVENLLKNKKPLRSTAIIYTLALTSVCSVFFFGSSLSYSFHYLFAMIGGNSSIADSGSLYLLKSYIVLLLVCAYASTDMFRNLIERSKKKWLKKTVEILTPPVIVGLLIICTIELSYTGESEMMLSILREAV